MQVRFFVVQQVKAAAINDSCPFASGVWNLKDDRGSPGEING